MSGLVGVDGERQVKVLLAVPAGDHVTTRFALDFARLVGYINAQQPEIRSETAFAMMSILPYSRHLLVKRAQERQCTHILFIDSDMGFPPDALQALLKRNEPIVATNYTTRKAPHTPTAANSDGKGGLNAHVYTTPDTVGLEEVGRVGFGLILIDLDVFAAVPEPWFVMPWLKGAGGYLGEDVFFCIRAREHGFKILVDHDLSQDIVHVGEFTYAQAHAVAERDRAAAYALEHPAEVPKE